MPAVQRAGNRRYVRFGHRLSGGNRGVRQDPDVAALSAWSVEAGQPVLRGERLVVRFAFRQVGERVGCFCVCLLISR